jgi:hypothetical protein
MNSKMSFLCEEWLAAGRSRASRQSTLTEMENIIKDRAKADAKAASKKVHTYIILLSCADLIHTMILMIFDMNDMYRKQQLNLNQSSEQQQD